MGYNVILGKEQHIVKAVSLLDLESIAKFGFGSKLIFDLADHRVVHRIIDKYQVYCILYVLPFFKQKSMYKRTKKKSKGTDNQDQVQRRVIRVSNALTIANPHAAGIDVSDTQFDLALRNGEDGGFEVSTYGTFTEDVDSIVDYLKERHITTVAMESTGVYYVALYVKLEQAGIEPYLVNARHAKNVTGRKKDDTDAIWLLKLHTYGLLQKSFQPSSEGRVLRSYVRHRKMLVTTGSDSVRRMQKALELMNIKLHTVISDLLGKTGMSMVRAILNGCRSASELAQYRDARIRASQGEIIKSLEGIWHEEHLFALKQAYDTYMFHQLQVAACDKQIEAELEQQMARINDGEIPSTSQEQGLEKRKPKKNQYHFEAGSRLHYLLGVDLCLIPGISEITGMEIIAEIGTDMSRWESVKLFTAWANVCPNTKISGGKILSSKMMKKKNHVGLCLRMAAVTVARSKTPLGDYYRRIKGRIGGKGAVVATAHKLARIIYTMLKEKKEYDSSIYKESQQNLREKQIRFYEKKIADLKKAA